MPAIKKLIVIVIIIIIVMTDFFNAISSKLQRSSFGITQLVLYFQGSNQLVKEAKQPNNSPLQVAAPQLQKRPIL